MSRELVAHDPSARADAGTSPALRTREEAIDGDS